MIAFVSVPAAVPIIWSSFSDMFDLFFLLLYLFVKQKHHQRSAEKLVSGVVKPWKSSSRCPDWKRGVHRSSVQSSMEIMAVSLALRALGAGDNDG